MKFKILKINDAEYFSSALELLNRTQGRNLFAPDYLDKLAVDSNSLIIGAFESDELIGIGVSQIISDFEFYLPFDNNIVIELTLKKVASFSTLAITESYQGQGVGQKISRMRLEWVKNMGSEVILGLSWVSGLKHTSDRVFEKMGFRAIKKVDNFFVKYSLEKPFECPGCMQQPCLCAAILYRLDL